MELVKVKDDPDNGDVMKKYQIKQEVKINIIDYDFDKYKNIKQIKDEYYCSDISNEEEGETVNEGDLKEYKLVFTCEECNYITYFTKNLELHKLTHKDDKPFACNKCDYRSYLKSVLKKHSKSVHPNDIPLVCKQCDFTTKNKKCLKEHKKKHRIIKKLKCDQCKYSSYSNSILTSHRKTFHSLNNPFKSKQYD